MSQASAKSVAPIINVRSLDEVQNFYKDKLEFTRLIGIAGEDGLLNRATFALDGARLMFARTEGKMDASGKQPVEIYLEVADVDAYHAQLQQRGVPISNPLSLQWWGDKTFTITDPNGYEIWFYQKVGVPKPPQDVKIV